VTLRAGVYARYSSDNQRDTSLTDQERISRQEVERHGCKIVVVWEDAALTGQLGEEQRPGLRAMLAAAEAGEIDVLIVDDSSRLSRNNSDALRIMERLSFWGVGLIAVADGINTITNPQSSRLLYGLKAAVNEEYLRAMGHQVKRGMEGQVRKGRSAGGLPYGYRSRPIIDERGRVAGAERVIDDAEAAVVRRIFRLYVGDEDGHPHSPREIGQILSADGIAPPGARWPNRTARQRTTWSYTSIIGHRKYGKGILNNQLYAGKLIWNKSKWLRHPDTKAYTYRLRPAHEHIVVEVPELRIVPQELWDRVQARLTLQATLANIPGRRNVGQYLLSGFVKCGVCGGPYTKMNYSYRCAMHRNRGAAACPNTRGVSAAKLQRVVIQALRERLYSPANLKTLISLVRDELLRKAKQRHRVTPNQREQALRTLEGEIANITEAVASGKPGPSGYAVLMRMLEERAERLQALRAGHHASGGADPQTRFERVLAELPERVQTYLEDLENLLAGDQVARGKEILASLGTEVVISPDGTAEILGDLGKAIVLVGGEWAKKYTSVAGAEGFEPPTSGFGDQRSAS
jgi:site-specific DNA recombinase